MAEITNEQIVDLVKQMPPEDRREVLRLLAQSSPSEQARRGAFMEDQLRRLSLERGRNWDQMTDDEREAFIDDLVHEDRPCAQ